MMMPCFLNLLAAHLRRHIPRLRMLTHLSEADEVHMDGTPERPQRYEAPVLDDAMRQSL